MPSYNFEINGQTNTSRLVQFVDLVEAKREALKLAGALIADAAEMFWDNPKWMLKVRDEDGATLFELQVLGAEGAADQTLSRLGLGEATFDQAIGADRAKNGIANR